METVNKYNDPLKNIAQHCKDSIEQKNKTDREKAMEWWESFGLDAQYSLRDKYYPGKLIDGLTKNQIESIWAMHTNREIPSTNSNTDLKCTPGEWAKTDISKRSTTDFRCTIASENNIVARVIGNSIEEAEANAHLIAPSKNMYEGHKKHYEECITILNKYANGKATEQDFKNLIGAIAENSKKLMQKANPNYYP